MVLAYVKKRKNCYVFWIGDVYENGFKRNCKSTKWVRDLDDKKLNVNRKDYENDEYWIERNEKIEKFKAKERRKKRGVFPYLIPSKPGNWYDYQEFIGWDEITN